MHIMQVICPRMHGQWQDWDSNPSSLIANSVPYHAGNLSAVAELSCPCMGVHSQLLLSMTTHRELRRKREVDVQVMKRIGELLQ